MGSSSATASSNVCAAKGLLTVEGQRHRRGVRGSESLYPGWTVGQLDLVARLQAQERRFAQLRVLVRWHGGWVRADKLRASLIALLDTVSAQARRMTANTVDESDRADRLAQAMTLARDDQESAG